MGNIVKLVLFLLLLGSSAQAEVFNKKHSTIVYNLDINESVDVEFTFKFKDIESLGDYKAKPHFAVYDHYRRVGNSGYNYIRYTFKKNTTKLNLPLKVGKYTIVLDAGGGYYNKPFDFSITKISGNFGFEKNNNFSEATPMKERSFYYGYLQSNNKQDVDYFKINMKNNGVLDLVFKVKEPCVKGKGYESILLYDGTKKNPLMVLTNVNKNIRKSIGVLKGDYYIKIRSNDKCIYNKEYTLAYLENKSTHTELEPNDTFATATSILADSYYYKGRLEHKNTEDIDMFVFDVKKASKITFAFKQPNFELKNKSRAMATFSVDIIELKGSKYQIIDSFSTKKGLKKDMQYSHKFKTGRYYLRVKGMDWSGSFGNDKKGTKYLEYAIALIK